MTARDVCPFEDEVLLLGDGEAPFARRVVIEAHLGVCPECAALEEALTLAEDVLRSSPEPVLGSAERALARLPSAAPSLRPWALAAAAALVVGLGVHARMPERRRAAASVDTAGVASTDDAAAPGSQPAAPGAQTGEGTRDPVLVAPDRATAALPVLPPPVPPVGPTLRRVLAALDPVAADYDEQVAAAAADVRRRGRRGALALGEVLSGDERTLVGPALDVAARLDSPHLADPVAALVSDPRFGDRAAALLVQRRDPRMVAALVARLDAEPSVAAEEALATLGGEDAAQELAARFWAASPDDRVRLLGAVVRADARVGAALCIELEAEPDFVRSGMLSDTVRAHRQALGPHLVRTVRGRDVFRARAAARSLGRTGDASAVDVLAEVARSPRTRASAVAGLLDLGFESARLAAFDATVAAGTDGVAAAAWVDRAEAEALLLGIVRAGPDVRRRTALRLLGACGGDETVSSLAAGDLPRSVRGEVIDALGAIGGDAAAARLEQMTGEPGLEERVIRALGQTRSLHAVRALRAVAQADAHRRPAVVAALADLVTPASVEVLVTLLDDPRAGRSALDALAAMPLGVAVPGLLRPYADDDLVPLPVRRALARLAGRDLGSSPVAWRGWWAARS